MTWFRLVGGGRGWRGARKKDKRRRGRDESRARQVEHVGGSGAAGHGKRQVLQVVLGWA